MRVLTDENLPHALRNHLPGHEVMTAAYAGFAGLKNGALLKAAFEAKFDVLVTGDQTLRYEQNLAEHKMALVCLSAIAWRLIEPNVGKIRAAVDAATPGSITPIDRGRFVRSRRPPGPAPG